MEKELWEKFVLDCKEKGYEVGTIMQFKPDVFKEMKPYERELYTSTMLIFFEPKVLIQKIEPKEEEVVVEAVKELPKTE